MPQKYIVQCINGHQSVVQPPGKERNTLSECVVCGNTIDRRNGTFVMVPRQKVEEVEYDWLGL